VVQLRTCVFGGKVLNITNSGGLEEVAVEDADADADADDRNLFVKIVLKNST
jgi:hypothetical protein